MLEKLLEQKSVCPLSQGSSPETREASSGETKAQQRLQARRP